MVKKILTFAVICSAAVAPAVAFAPQSPLASRLMSTDGKPFDSTKMFMSDDDVRVPSCH